MVFTDWVIGFYMCSNMSNMIDISFQVNKFNIQLDTDSNLGKSILDLINNSTEPNKAVRIKFESNKSFDLKVLGKFAGSIVTVEIGENFNTPIDLTKFNKLKEVYVGRKFNSEIKFSSNVEKIIFSEYSQFNTEIKEYPKSLKYLEFGHIYDKQLNNLPVSLETLKTGNDFNQPLNNLPNGLKYLYLGYSFEHKLDFLPESLLTLEFMADSPYDQPLDNLPIGIQKLYLSFDFSQSINNLPDSIIELRMSSLKKITGNKFPSKIKKLTLLYASELSKIKNFLNYGLIERLEVCQISYDDDKINIDKFIDITCKVKEILLKFNYNNRNIKLIETHMKQFENIYNTKIIKKNNSLEINYLLNKI